MGGLRRARSEGNLHERGCMAESRLKVGEFLHSRWFESFVIFLILVELSITLTEVALDAGVLCINPEEIDALHVRCEAKGGPRTAELELVFSSISRAIVLVFTVEMSLKLLIGFSDMLCNPWHVLDVAVVATNFLIEFIISPLQNED